MQIQEGYRGHEIIAGLYNSEGNLVALSNSIAISTTSSITTLDIVFNTFLNDTVIRVNASNSNSTQSV